jgi:short-subunit dehydrogenase
MNEPNVAIVTGASSGIGMETALGLARGGFTVVLAARREDKLKQIAQACQAAGGKNALVVPTDVAREEQVNALVARTVEQFGRVDVMVNNAGYGTFGRVHETDDSQMRRIFDVNFHGLFYGCRAVVPVMMRQRSGHIFNVSSVIGKRGTPFHGPYCATKFAICGLSDSLRVEMLPYGVRVTTVCPALTDTEFFANVQGDRDREAAGYRRMRSKQPASVVARKIVATVGRNRPELVFTAGGKFLAVVSALWPKAADKIMSVYLKDLLGGGK